MKKTKYVGRLTHTNKVTCLKCKEKRIGLAIQVFKNETRHIYARCFNCQYIWYLSKGSVSNIDKLEIITTEKQRKREEDLKQTLFDMAFGENTP